MLKTKNKGFFSFKKNEWIQKVLKINGNGAVVAIFKKNVDIFARM